MFYIFDVYGSEIEVIIGRWYKIWDGWVWIYDIIF